MTQVIFDHHGFVDHSPSEQLCGAPDAWHTTVLVFAAEGVGGVTNLKNAIASKVSQTPGELGKWSKRSEKYRREVVLAVRDFLPNSGAWIFALSATERVIVANKNMLLAELGLIGKYREGEDAKGRPKLIFGPVTNAAGEEIELDYLESRALMLLWIARFFVQAYETDWIQLCARRPESVGLTWHLHSDWLVGDNDQVSAAIKLLKLVTRPFFDLRMVFALQGDSISEYVLADNIAGLLDQNACGKRNDSELNQLQNCGALHWQKLS